jgi:hypothetical protein
MRRSIEHLFRFVVVVLCTLPFACRPSQVFAELKVSATAVFQMHNAVLTPDGEQELDAFIAYGAGRLSRFGEALPRAKGDIARFASEAVRQGQVANGHVSIGRAAIRAAKRIFCPCYPFC